MCRGGAQLLLLVRPMQQSQFSLQDLPPPAGRAALWPALLHLLVVPQNNGTQSCALISKMGLCFWIKPHSRLNLSANAVSAVQMSPPLPISDYVMSEADMVPLCRSTWSGICWTSEIHTGPWIGTLDVLFFFFLSVLESWFSAQRWTVASLGC